MYYFSKSCRFFKTLSENEISCNCGQPRKAKVQNRIIGGSETAKYEYPWLVR